MQIDQAAVDRIIEHLELANEDAREQIVAHLERLHDISRLADAPAQKPIPRSKQLELARRVHRNSERLIESLTKLLEEAPLIRTYLSWRADQAEQGKFTDDEIEELPPYAEETYPLQPLLGQERIEKLLAELQRLHRWTDPEKAHPRSESKGQLGAPPDYLLIRGVAHLADLYQDLTGRRPTTTTDPIGRGRREQTSDDVGGHFVVFVQLCLEAVRPDLHPFTGAQIKNALRTLRRRGRLGQ